MNLLNTNRSLVRAPIISKLFNSAWALLLCLVLPLLSCAQAVGTIITIAGNGTKGFSGDGGPATSASLNEPVGLAFDSAGNLYFSDAGNNRIRKVSVAGTISTVAGNGSGLVGSIGDGGPALIATLRYPAGLTFDAAGNLYVADLFNHRIRKVGTNGIITTVAGNGANFPTGDGGPATRAAVYTPSSVALDSAGNLLISEMFGYRIRKVSANGTITTLRQFSDADFYWQPCWIALDSGGNIYASLHAYGITTTTTIERMSPAGVLTRVAGGGTGAGEGGPALSAQLLEACSGLLVDGAGTLYFSERGRFRVRKVDSNGIITTVAGNGLKGFSGDGGLATSASLDGPYSVALDAVGNLYIADGSNHRIRKVILVAPSALTLGVASLSFSAQQGGSSPPAQTVSLAIAGNSSLAWTATVSTSSSWLKVTPLQGTGSGTLTVTVDPAGLAPGTYTGVIQVNSLASNGTQSVNVALTVTAAGTPTFALTPASMRFVVDAGSNPTHQTIQVINSGTGALGWTAAATTQSGGNWLSISPTTGVAPSTVTLSISSASLPAGAYAGTITFTALPSANATNSPQTVTVTLAVGAPLINNNGVVNGASFSRDAVVSPGSLASMFGVNLAKDTVVATSLPLPTTLGGVQVFVAGTAAPLFFVSPGQINFQVPVETSGTTVAMAVSSAGVRGPDSPVSIAPEVPGIFTATPGGSGQGAVLNQDFSTNSAQNAAEAGSVIQIFATGLGATNPVAQTGGPGATSEPFNRTVKVPVVLINGAPAEVLFSAQAPGFVSLYQVNARIPAATAPGSAVTLQIQIGGRSSNSVNIAVRAPG